MNDELLPLAIRNYLRTVPEIMYEIKLPEYIRVISSESTIPNLALGNRWIGVKPSGRDNNPLRKREKGRAFSIVDYSTDIWIFDTCELSDESSIIGSATRMSVMKLSTIVGEMLDALKNKHTLKGQQLPGGLIDAVFVKTRGPIKFNPPGMAGLSRDMVSTRTGVTVTHKFQRFNEE